jgi:dipeptidyl aminopeptidase/acylaminoacyl peptidase
MWKRTLPAVLLLMIIGSPLVYYQAGNLVYTQAAASNPACSGHAERNSPDAFSVELWHEDVSNVTHQKNETLAANLDGLWFTSWENVTVGVPGEAIDLAGWVMEHNASQPWVILVHGIRSCKANHEVLIPAAWLHQAGFNVVLFDMRDHGDSTVEDGLVSAGQREYRDLLAVWQWLQDERNASPERIGVLGVSMGAGTAAIAFGEESSLQAVFLESPFSSMGSIIEEELAFAGFPPFLKDAAVFAGKVSSGDDLVKREPIEAMKRTGDRSVFITQSLEDVRINIHHGRAMCDVATAHVGDNGSVDCWFESSAVAHNDRNESGVLSHVTLMLTHPETYRSKMVNFFEQALGSTQAVV